MKEVRTRSESTDFSTTFSLALAVAVVGLLVLIPLALVWIEHLMNAPLPGGD